MGSYDNKLKEFAKELYAIEAIKFEDHKTENGLLAPVHCDMAVIVRYPKLMVLLTDLLLAKIGTMKNVNVLNGISDTALSLSTAVSINAKIPLIVRNKQSENTKKTFNKGAFHVAQNCLVIEDVVTMESSLTETVKDLRAIGLTCTDVLVLLKIKEYNYLENFNVKLHHLLELSQLVDILEEAHLINGDIVRKIKSYLIQTGPTQVVKNRLGLSFHARALLARNPISKQLFEIMHVKQSTLCVAADLLSSADLLNMAELVGPHICALKTHIDIMEDFNPNFVSEIQKIAKRHNFVLFEDRKFADYGKALEYQYSKGVYNISSWSPLTSTHSLMGKGVLDVLKSSKGLDKRGVILLAGTTATGNLITDYYVEETLKMAEEYPELIAGIYCENPLFLNQPGLVQFCPGVQINSKETGLGHSYNSPETVVLEKGADIAMVGRGITQASDPAATAKNYRQLLWKSYEKRINQYRD